MEDEGGRKCPSCGSKRNPVSRYEWFLADELSDVLDRLDVDFTITEQWRLEDRRGFGWFFDLRVEVRGRLNAVEVIEVNGESHLRAAVFNGHTRDDEKLRALRTTEPGAELRIVANDECSRLMVVNTARSIAGALIRRAL